MYYVFSSVFPIVMIISPVVNKFVNLILHEEQNNS